MVDLSKLGFYNNLSKLGKIVPMSDCTDGCFTLYVSESIGKKMSTPNKFWGKLVADKKIDMLDVQTPTVFIVSIKKQPIASVYQDHYGCKTITVSNSAEKEKALTELASEIVSRLNL